MIMDKNMITSAQIKKIHTMFSLFDIEKESKKRILLSLTKKRTPSVKNLTFEEAKFLISYLEGKNEEHRAELKEQSRKEVASIYHLSYLIGMCYGDTYEDKLMNIAKINKFCRERGTVKKNISEMNLIELRKTKKQFEAILDKNTTDAVNKLISNTLNKKEAIYE